MNPNQLQCLADYVRYLSLMAVRRANSGHIGLPLGCAEVGVLLYEKFLRFSAQHPKWRARDRFVLSAGHGSMLLYALNYLYGYPIQLRDLAEFRQVDGVLHGHPERNLDLGVETTTGPLGQGVANAVGIAIEAKQLASRLSQPRPVGSADPHVYVLAGDGCLMEGIAYEACSLAGHLNLGNLTLLYDSNNATIDGPANLAFSEDVLRRFEAMGWAVADIDMTTADDFEGCLSSLHRQAKALPKCVVLKTTIGAGVRGLAGSYKAHAQIPEVQDIVGFASECALSNDMRSAAKDRNASLKDWVELQLKTGDFFEPEPIRKHRELQAQLQSERYGALGSEGRGATTIPSSLELLLSSYDGDKKPAASREWSSAVLGLCAKECPQITGGSADLASSTKAFLPEGGWFGPKTLGGRNIAFGVREHAMAAIGNGLALNGDTWPFTSTFFAFFDYMKPAVRLAALMGLKHLFIFSHDSFYVGEDGPTHHPIEHLVALRLIPNLSVFRPCNPKETALAYLHYLRGEGPVAIVTTRQKLSPIPLAKDLNDDAFAKGAYVLEEDEGNLDLVLVGSGSEVSLLLQVKNELNKQRKSVRLVSAPSMERFEQSGPSHWNKLLSQAGKKLPVLLCEAASYRSLGFLFDPLVLVCAANEFGLSGKANDVAKTMGFDVQSLVAKALSHIEQPKEFP